jgi:hypothetical protein
MKRFSEFGSHLVLAELWDTSRAHGAGTAAQGHRFTEKGRHEDRNIRLFITLVSLLHSAVISISPLSQQVALPAPFIMVQRPSASIVDTTYFSVITGLLQS